jgi:hypothetical protein
VKQKTLKIYLAPKRPFPLNLKLKKFFLLDYNSAQQNNKMDEIKKNFGVRDWII